MKKLLAFAVAILMAAPAFAAVQNVRVSGDIESTYLNRYRFNLGVDPNGLTSNLKSQGVFLTQTRLRVDADLSDNVSASVGLINERPWQVNTSSSSGIDLYLSYVTLREFLYSPLTLSVGRQVFHYGNGLILGDGGENNAAGADSGILSVAADLTKATAYDGIKAILDYKPLTVDLIYFKNDQDVVDGDLNSERTSSDVYGINANYQLGDESNSVIEGYLFSRIDGGLWDGRDRNKSDRLYVPGLRVSTTPVKGLNAQAEVAWQLGMVGTGSSPSDTYKRRNALAYQFMASYAIESESLEKYKPMVNASYTHVPGDKDTANKKNTAWDTFNESQASGTIYNSIFDLTNMNIISAGLSLSPVQDVTTAFVWSNLRADKKYTGTNTLSLIQPDGSSSVSPSTTSKKSLGNEYDVNINYAYTEDVTLGVSLGWFVPGSAFAKANDSTASQALAKVLVNF